MSRTKIYDMLAADAASNAAGSLGALGLVPAALYAAEAADSPRKYPFLTMRWGETTRGIGTVSRQPFDIWVYNKDHDYLPIDNIIKRIRYMFDYAGPLSAAEGWITQIEWEGDGPDARDDGYDAITRSSSYMLIGNTR